MKRIISVLIILILLLSLGCYTFASEGGIEGELLNVVENGNNDETNLSTETGADGSINKNFTLTPQDFSDAKYELNYAVGTVTLTVSNIKNMNDDNINSIKYSVSGSANTAPDVKQNTGYMVADTNNGKLSVNNFEKYVELAQDLYINIFYADSSDNVVELVKSKKLERKAYPKYADAFSDGTQASNSGFQLILENVAKSSSTTRKGNIKIGRINDTGILNNIKDNKEAGWEALLRYAKSDTSSIYNKVQSCSQSFLVFKEPLGIDASKVVDQAYYYLYIELDTENGKYYPDEAVTLSQSKVYDSGNWYMFFVGSSEFKWNIPSQSGGNTPQPSTPTPTQNPPAQPSDPTVAPTSLPRTGADVAILVSIVGLTIAGGIAFIKSKKYRGIK